MIITQIYQNILNDTKARKRRAPRRKWARRVRDNAAAAKYCKTWRWHVMAEVRIKFNIIFVIVDIFVKIATIFLQFISNLQITDFGEKLQKR